MEWLTRPRSEPSDLFLLSDGRTSAGKHPLPDLNGGGAYVADGHLLPEGGHYYLGPFGMHACTLHGFP